LVEFSRQNSCVLGIFHLPVPQRSLHLRPSADPLENELATPRRRSLAAADAAIAAGTLCWLLTVDNKCQASA
jgi:hypothetical protein